MLLYKNKGFVTNSEHPNDDWIGDADYVIPDGSELAEKIISMYPNFDLVFGDDGQPVDAIRTDPEPAVPEITEEQRLTAVENAVEEIINMLMEE